MDDLTCFSKLAEGGASASAAIDTLYTRYARRFWKFLRARFAFSPAHAEDVVQTVFLKLLENRGALSSIAAPESYLWTAVRNTAMDQFRRQSKEVLGEDLASRDTDDDRGETWIETMPETTSGDEADDGRSDCSRKALDVLKRRSPSRYEAISLIVFGEMSHKEAAAILGKAEATMREFFRQAKMAYEALLRQLCGEFFVDKAAVN